MKQTEINHLEKVRAIFDILHGKKEADLLLKNLNILDVHGETVYHGSLLIYDKRIVALNPDESVIQVKEVFDGQGLYAIPGLIDAHLHFESQLAHPTALAEAMVPCGTTTIFAECLDLLSAAGEDGVRAAQNLFRDYDKLPYRLYAFAPGKKTAAWVTKEVLEMEPVIGLGEFEHFTYSKGDEDDFQKAAWVRAKGGFMNGHWGLTALPDMVLNYLPAIGVSNNHDVWNGDDIEKSIRYGFPTQIKFGVGSSEVIKTLLRSIVDRKFPTENFMLCTDNISIERLLKMGHMDWIISLCTQMGINPIKAIKMASYNTAKSFNMDHQIGSLTPGRFADIVLTDSLSQINPLYVFKDGELIAKDRKMLKNADIDYSAMCTKGVTGLDDLTPEQLDIVPLELSEDGQQAKVYLFDVYGRGHAKFYQEIWVPVVDGKVVAEHEGEKLSRLSVIRRYADGKRHIVNGLFKGVYVEHGAVATSWPAPIPYFVVVGQESEEMCYCAKEVDKYSGACIVTDNKTNKSVLPLEIYGVMANMTVSELTQSADAIDAALEEMGNRNEGEPVVNKLLSLFISLHRFRFME
ncbi:MULTISPECIES: amidohydrolase family protein [Brevibacillus]|jgi:adenine deaminase|uniref:adenine deaminase n=1 Tax=Brevibacillus parabrevis TaxID=54914 RepID=A0A4Y3P8L1_BREPA|nr:MULTISPECIES: amidohydrolase family protein [Brevibacillus]MDH6348445.1 adenine deaminase [Brevibacillus sp. 1238]MDR5000577.1 adenine deaminase C-terminal domain-containing protein [Brevibacillus parabrevis]RNB96783.1 adenine deaminase [Brevibacillus parabrevis]UED70507.1 amidohydrolase family protein [Brevibacillus sp. HD3.3A]GEB30790.1 adenine deaminase [Brevibacillus parabrevis]